MKSAYLRNRYPPRSVFPRSKPELQTHLRNPPLAMNPSRKVNINTVGKTIIFSQLSFKSSEKFWQSIHQNASKPVRNSLPYLQVLLVCVHRRHVDPNYTRLYKHTQRWGTCRYRLLSVVLAHWQKSERCVYKVSSLRGLIRRGAKQCPDGFLHYERNNLSSKT